MKDVKMKSFVILTSSLLLTSTCCAMNSPSNGDNSLLLRRSAPPATTQPGVKPPEDIDLSKMSVNSRARYMTDFVDGQLAERQCSYEGTLIGLEDTFKAKTNENPDAVIAWERADRNPESEDGLTASKVSSQTKHRPLGQKDRTMSAGPKQQSIFPVAPIDSTIALSIATPVPATHSTAVPSACDDADDEGSEYSSTQDDSKPSSKQDGQNDELTFDMDDC